MSKSGNHVDPIPNRKHFRGSPEMETALKPDIKASRRELCMAGAEKF
jgi:hypothetical protein